MDSAQAVRRFLDALQVPPERIPVDPDAQAALYRSQLAGKRMLVVLDNARDSAQVRPLLPGAHTCLVLVTSRNQLTGLIAADGAHPITLDLLTDDEARQLLARRLGADRVAAEPAAVEEIITRCAHLPLALALVAARAAVSPRGELRLLAEELRGAGCRWQMLTSDDPTTDVRAVFSWSYHTPGRYAFHDLLRAYASDLAQCIDTDEQRHTATHRILDHYLHTAHTAARLLHPARDPITLTPPAPEVTPQHPADHRQGPGLVHRRASGAAGRRRPRRRHRL
jgi:NB-ARC domain